MCYCGTRLIVIGELFSKISKVWKNWEIPTDIRRRSVTIREILRKQQYQVRWHSNIWKKKNTGKYGRWKNCAKTMSKNWGKKTFPIRMNDPQSCGDTHSQTNCQRWSSCYTVIVGWWAHNYSDGSIYWYVRMPCLPYQVYTDCSLPAWSQMKPVLVLLRVVRYIEVWCVSTDSSISQIDACSLGLYMYGLAARSSRSGILVVFVAMGVLWFIGWILYEGHAPIDT